MTTLLYQTNSFLREFDVAVTAVEDRAVVLDQTAFYPGGGGQPHDLGTLSANGREWLVVKVEKRGGAARAAITSVTRACTSPWQESAHRCGDSPGQLSLRPLPHPLVR